MAGKHTPGPWRIETYGGMFKIVRDLKPGETPLALLELIAALLSPEILPIANMEKIRGRISDAIANATGRDE